jgi:hypothetical protein
MRSFAIIFLILNYCLSIFSQNIKFTRTFDTKRKLVPVSIINNHPDYFYVLRYNKLAHDLTLERRAKPSGEILSFTPFKLDSVNAGWFDYENLDHLFFAKDHKVYFLFERVTNFKKDIFLKVVDTSGKSSGFINIATLDKDKNMSDFNFQYKLTRENNILLIGSSFYINNTAKKIVMLYDPFKREKIWVRKLPLENSQTGYSQSFQCNSRNDLAYMMFKSRIVGFKRKVIGQTQAEIPVFYFDSLSMNVISEKGTFFRKNLSVQNLSSINTALVNMTDTTVMASLHFSKENDKGEESVFFLNEKFTTDLSTIIFSHTAPLNKRNIEKLTFYDGSDFNSPADKDYNLVKEIAINEKLIILSERTDENYYKEMILVQANQRTGIIEDQEIIPRKIFYFDDRTRFKNLGISSLVACGDTIHVIVIENKSNQKQAPSEFKYHDFTKARNVWGANVVDYTLLKNELKKTLIYKNANFDFIPLPYQSNQCDFVMYLNSGKLEKFAFLPLN